MNKEKTLEEFSKSEEFREEQDQAITAYNLKLTQNIKLLEGVSRLHSSFGKFSMLEIYADEKAFSQPIEQVVDAYANNLKLEGSELAVYWYNNGVGLKFKAVTNHPNVDFTCIPESLSSKHEIPWDSFDKAHEHLKPSFRVKDRHYMKSSVHHSVEDISWILRGALVKRADSKYTEICDIVGLAAEVGYKNFGPKHTEIIVGEEDLDLVIDELNKMADRASKPFHILVDMIKSSKINPLSKIKEEIVNECRRPQKPLGREDMMAPIPDDMVKAFDRSDGDLKSYMENLPEATRERAKKLLEPVMQEILEGQTTPPYDVAEKRVEGITPPEPLTRNVVINFLAKPRAEMNFMSRSELEDVAEFLASDNDFVDLLEKHNKVLHRNAMSVVEYVNTTQRHSVLENGWNESVGVFPMPEVEKRDVDAPGPDPAMFLENLNPELSGIGKALKEMAWDRLSETDVEELMAHIAGRKLNPKE